MIHEILPVGLLQCNCSVFGDETTREALVIDPGDQIGDILAIVKKHELRVKVIVITHAHIDHIGGAAKLKAATGAPVYMNARDQELYGDIGVQAAWLGMPEPESTEIDGPAEEGATLKLGGELGGKLGGEPGATAFHILHTPGHTQGSVSIWIPAENKLIAGDTLFRDSIGRTDLPGGDSRQILRSIHSKLLTLPESAVVVPGHGPKTTIGREKELNPFLR
jgi:hydroxyacylglutathione hydrolase